MKFLSTPSDIATEFDELLRINDRMSGAVAWAGWGFSSSQKLEKASRKIKKLVVGTHGFHTSPDFLKRFLGSKRVHLVRWTGPVFHPKIYLFERSNGDWSCIVGSANFTRPGFESNREACIVITSADAGSATLRRDVEVFIDRCRKLDGVEKSELRYYTAMSKTRHKLIDVTDTPDELLVNGPISKLQKMSWSQFCREVRRAGMRKQIPTDGRTKLLAHAREMLARKSLRQLSVDERKLIGGFGSPRNGDGEDLYDWAAFGSMWGAGTFKKLINQPSVVISEALDEIPPSGNVSREQYCAFVRSFRKAFPKGKGDGVATATRLLAMKRPDWFLCVDGANTKELRKRLGATARGKNYTRYWDSVIARIQTSIWYQSPRPKAPKDAVIWDGRAAFVDSICYRWKVKR